MEKINREETAIDHALTNKPESIKDYQKIEIAYSDHDLIYVDLNIKVTKLKIIRTITRDYRKLRSNKTIFLNLLKHINWEVLKDMSNIDEVEKFWTQEM